MTSFRWQASGVKLTALTCHPSKRVNKAEELANISTNIAEPCFLSLANFSGYSNFVLSLPKWCIVRLYPRVSSDLTLKSQTNVKNLTDCCFVRYYLRVSSGLTLEYMTNMESLPGTNNPDLFGLERQ
jgi:hypothetical protein